MEMEKYKEQFSLLSMTPRTLQVLRHQENYQQLITLYGFYLDSANRQRTNIPHTTTHFVAKGLKWRPNKVARYKRELINLGLVKDVRRVDPLTKRVIGFYIRVNLHTEPIPHQSMGDGNNGLNSGRTDHMAPPSPKTVWGENSRSEANGTSNALSPKENALKNNKMLAYNGPLETIETNLEDGSIEYYYPETDETVTLIM